MRSEQEIQKTLETLARELVTEGPLSERKNIARIATKQTLEWVLGKQDTPLTY